MRNDVQYVKETLFKFGYYKILQNPTGIMKIQISHKFDNIHIEFKLHSNEVKILRIIPSEF